MSAKLKSTPVVRALDLGFGFTKYTKGALCNGFELEVGAFAKLAGRSSDNSTAGTALGNFVVLTIDVDGAPYSNGVRSWFSR